MKGKMKKLVAFALAAIMVLGMGITAFAANDGAGGTTPEATPNPTIPNGSGTNGEYTLEVTNPAVNHAYKVYQIYTGDVSVNAAGKAVLANIKKGSALDGAGTALTQSEMDLLESKVNGLDYAKELAENITANTTVAATLTQESPSASLAGGYYLVIDRWAGKDAEGNTTEVPDGMQFSDFVISIVGATTFAPKTLNVPSFEKTVPVGSDKLTVISDKKVGDTIKFELNATMPDSFGSHDAYKVVFNDELSEGLTYKANSIKVAVNGTEVTETAVPEFDGQKLRYEIEDVFRFGGLKKETAANASITVTYEATINEKAKTRVGETNTATLDYTNGPGPDQIGSSTPSVVTVLTAKLQVNKVDGDNSDTPLAGAGFTLYKYSGTADGNKGDVVETIGAGTDKTEFTFGGLATGKYVLSETTTPAGYNTMDDIVVNVTFSSKTENNATVMDGLSVTTEGGVALTWSANDGTQIASAKIQNFTGVQLPSTGGIGTTIFYVVGGILVAAAGILLITKKRMSGRD